MKDSSLIISMMLFYIGAALMLISFIKDYKKSKKLSWYNSFFLVGFLSFIILGTLDTYNKYFGPKNDKKEMLDSLSSSNTGIKNNDNKNTNKLDTSIKKVGSAVKDGFQSLKQTPFARVDWAVKGTETTPLLIKHIEGDSIIYKFGNFGTGYAFDITSSVFYVFIKNNALYKQGLPNSPKKFGYEKWAPNFLLGHELISTYKDASIDSTYACLKIDYSDSTKIRKSFCSIIRLNYKNSIFTNIEQDTFNQIKKFLIVNNIWKPPFRQ